MFLSTQIGKHVGPTYAICQYDERTFFTGGADKIVGQWNIESRSQIGKAIRTPATVYSLASSESVLFIGTSTGNIHWIDLTLNEEIKNFDLHKGGVFSLKTKNGQLLASGNDGRISLWNIPNRELIRSLTLSEEKIRSAQWISSTEIGVACSDGSYHILDSDWNTALTVKHEEKALNTAAIWEGELYTGGWDGHIYRWRLDGTLLQKVPCHNYAIYNLIVWKNMLVSCSRDKTIKGWNTSLEPIFKIDKGSTHKRSVNDVIAIGGTLCSVSDDGQVLIHTKQS